MSGTRRPELRLCDFDISEETGFLPPSPPLTRLPNECFSKWEELAREAHTLIARGTLRDKIHLLPEAEFNPRTLGSEAEWCRAYVLLSFLSHAYLWAEGETGLPDNVPQLLAVPWVSVSDHLGLPPVATYTTVVLHNWRLRDSHSPMKTVENMVAIQNFTGTEDESWFYMVHVSIELAAVPGIKAVVAAVSSMAHGDDKTLTKNLSNITDSLKGMKIALKRMYERCDQEVFHMRIRPFLAGTKGLDAFPDGLVYKGVSPIAKKFAGTSAAQSSTIPTFDTFFGVTHTGANAEFLSEMRQHMPPKHREFLMELSRQSSVRQYAIQSGNRELIQAYNDAIHAFSDFRTEHVILVTRYIVNQRGKSANVSLEDKGTGGTDFMKFLKQVRDDTRALLIEL